MTTVFNPLPFEAKPLKVGRLIFQQASPLALTLGLEVLEHGRGQSITRLPFNQRIACAKSKGCIDRLAIIGLLDHSVVYALGSVIDEDVGMVTFDYRIDFSDAALSEGDITAKTNVLMLGRHCATVQNIAYDKNDQVVATGTTLFRLGGFPGGTPPCADAISNYDPSACLGPYHHTLGLEKMEGEFYLEANNPSIIGWESAGTLHGGAIAALLMAACQSRAEQNGDVVAGKKLQSLHIRFLRPARADAVLLSQSRVERSGRAGSFIEAACFHDVDKKIASAEATFIST